MAESETDTSAHIRLARQDDRTAVDGVVDAAYSRYVPLIGRKPGPMLDDYAALIRESRVHVLEADRVVRGVLVLIPEGATMLLDNIAVHPTSQGRGYGRALLEFAERAAGAAGCRVIPLYTNEVMTENVSLYGRHGYVETHRTTENCYRRVFMRKELQ